MIELLYGLPGDGKSYSATKLVVDILARQKCYVCHNLPLASIGTLAEYFEVRGGEVPDLAGRLRALTDGEVGRFWRCLGPGWTVPGGTGGKGEVLEGSKSVDLGNGRKLTVPDYDGLPNDFPGVVYVLDEAHIHFSAYKWAEISEEAMWAVSQHRHLGMEVILVSQHPEKIAKALRRDIHRYTRVKNFGNRRTMGFVAAGRFRRITYPELPTKGSEVMIEESSWFRFDPAIGALYSTNAGVGIVGKVFNVERKPKGMPLKMLFAIVPFCLIVIWSVPYYGSKLVSHGLVAAIGMGGGMAHKAVSAMVGGPTNAPAVDGTGIPAVGWRPPAGSEGSGPVRAPAAARELHAYAYCSAAPEAASWTLDDGTVVRRESPGFEGGGRGWLVYRGKRYDYSPKPYSGVRDDSSRGSVGWGGPASGLPSVLPRNF